MAVGVEQDVNIRRAEGAGLVYAPELVSHLNGVAKRLTSASPVTGVPLRVHLRAFLGYGAVSTPDANVYLDLGLLHLLQSEDEVAAVLAHELGHVMLDHHASDGFAWWQKRGLQAGELASTLEEKATEMGIAARAKTANGKREKQEALLWANLNVLSPTWNRAQELEADVVAADLLARAGYNVTALFSMLDALASLPPSPAAGEPAPLPSDLAEPLARARLPTSLPGVDAAPLDLLQSVASVLEERAGQEARQVQTRMARSHPDLAERRARAEEYVLREGHAESLPDLRLVEWQHALERPETRSILESHEQAFAALEQMEARDVARAEALAQSAANGRASRLALPRYASSRARLARGRRDLAFHELEAAFGAPEPSGLVYRAAADLLAGQGRREDARDVLELGWRRLGETPALLPELIMANRSVGDSNRVAELLVVCEATHPDLARACRDAGR
jgi:Zn-dependent protease with chaperone function